MKITALTISKFLGIRELSINRFGQINVISGGNGAGKSSLLAAIKEVMQSSGRKPELINDGCDKATILMKLDDRYEVTRELTRRGDNRVKITDAGRPLTTAPATWLKSLLGGEQFNPVAFFEASAADRRKMILKAFPVRLPEALVTEIIGIDTDLLNLDRFDFEQNGLELAELIRQDVYDRRTEVGREITRLRGSLETDFKDLPEGFSTEKWRGFEFGDAMKELETAHQEARKQARERQELDRLREQAAGMANRRNALSESLNAQNDQLKVTRESIDTTAQKLTEARDNLDTVNRELEETQKLVIRLREELAKAEGVLAARNFKQQTAQESHNELARRLNSLQEKIERDQAAFDDVEKTIKDMDREREDIAEHGKVLAIAVDAFQEPPIKELQEKITAYQADQKLALKAEEMERRQVQLADQEGCHQRLEELHDRLKNDLQQKLIESVNLPVSGLAITREGIMVDGRPDELLSTSEKIRMAVRIAQGLCGTFKVICVDGLEALDNDNRGTFLDELESNQEYQYFLTTVTGGELDVEPRR